MIYFQTADEKHVIIIDPSALDSLRHGHAILSPDGLVFIALSPDEAWTAAEFQKEFSTGEKKLTAERMKQILAEGLLRSEAKPDDQK